MWALVQLRQATGGDAGLSVVPNSAVYSNSLFLLTFLI